MEKGIKEISELLDGLAVVIPELLEIKKDGIGLEDIDNVVNLLTKMDVLQEAVKDLSLIDDEIKDLDEAETVIIVGKVFKLIEAFKPKA